MTMRSRRARAATAALGSVFVALAIACQPSAPAALEDTPENRAAQIERYFAAQPPEQMLKDMVDNMSQRMPEEQRTRFIDLMTKHIDIGKLNAAMRESMAKHFTADELRALADFYGSELGKSAMEKFGGYMSDVMPAIQAEMMAALAKAQSEFEQQEAPAEQQQAPADPEPAQEPPKG